MRRLDTVPPNLEEAVPRGRFDANRAVSLGIIDADEPAEDSGVDDR